MRARRRMFRPIRMFGLVTGLVLVAACGADDDATSRAAAVAPPAASADAGPASTPATGHPDALGQLVLRMDGTSTTFETLPDRGLDRPPSASVMAVGPMRLLQVQSHLPGDPMKQVTLSANLMEQGGAFAPAGEAELDVFLEGTNGPGLMASALDVQWNRIELDADGGHVSGTFSGSACQAGAPAAGPATDDGCVPVEGRFDTAVRARAL